MGDLIELKTKTKLNDAPSYEDRMAKCLETEEVQGINCTCYYCKYKRKLAEDLMVTASQHMVQEMTRSHNPFFMSDLYDVLALAAECLKTEVNSK